MRQIEKALGYLATLGAVLMAGLAVFVVGTLLAKGPAPDRNFAATMAGKPVAETAGSTAEAAATDAQATGTEPASAAEEPAPAAVAAVPDAAAGEKVFAKCKACHTVEEGGANRVGPNLWSVVGRAIASHEGFKYSDAMAAETARTWDAASLDSYLADPKGSLPGNKMAFAGIKNAGDRHNLIAWLAQQSASPVSAEELGLSGAGQAAAPAAGEPAAADGADAADAAPPVQDPPPVSAERQAEIDALVAALADEVKTLDYQRARYHPIHFSPQIEKASDAECLVCHSEVIEQKPLEKAPAGISAIDALAWYQTLDTYAGDQQTFHWRHIESPFAKQVMNLSCNFCHKGNDPREESPDMEPNKVAFSAAGKPDFTNRKMVNPSETCLRCHGAMPDPVNIMGLAGPWHEARVDLEDEATPNGCLTCHEDLYRTVRHRVTYLKAASIEEAAKAGSDVCYGCHGGRSWYRISYPYPRHPWPDMDPETPDWAVGRPTESDPEYQLPPQAAQ